MLHTIEFTRMQGFFVVLLLTATCLAGAVVGVIAAAFAVLFMKIHKVFEKIVSSVGLHVSQLHKLCISCMTGLQ